MSVPWVGGLEGDTARPGSEDDVDDVGQRHVVMVRALVVAPAQMHTRLVGRDVGQRVVERLDVQAGHGPKFVEAQRSELDVPPHREIRAVDLENEPGPGHRLVLVFHRVGDGEEVRLVGRVVVVAKEEGHDAG